MSLIHHQFLPIAAHMAVIAAAADPHTLSVASRVATDAISAFVETHTENAHRGSHTTSIPPPTQAVPNSNDYLSASAPTQVLASLWRSAHTAIPIYPVRFTSFILSFMRDRRDLANTLAPLPLHSVPVAVYSQDAEKHTITVTTLPRNQNSPAPLIDALFAVAAPPTQRLTLLRSVFSPLGSSAYTSAPVAPGDNAPARATCALVENSAMESLLPATAARLRRTLVRLLPSEAHLANVIDHLSSVQDHGAAPTTMMPVPAGYAPPGPQEPVKTDGDTIGLLARPADESIRLLASPLLTGRAFAQPHEPLPPYYTPMSLPCDPNAQLSRETLTVAVITQRLCSNIVYVCSLDLYAGKLAFAPWRIPPRSLHAALGVVRTYAANKRHVQTLALATSLLRSVLALEDRLVLFQAAVEEALREPLLYVSPRHVAAAGGAIAADLDAYMVDPRAVDTAVASLESIVFLIAGEKARDPTQGSDLFSGLFAPLASYFAAHHSRTASTGVHALTERIEDATQRQMDATQRSYSLRLRVDVCDAGRGLTALRQEILGLMAESLPNAPWQELSYVWELAHHSKSTACSRDMPSPTASQPELNKLVPARSPAVRARLLRMAELLLALNGDGDVVHGRQFVVGLSTATTVAILRLLAAPTPGTLTSARQLLQTRRVVPLPPPAEPLAAWTIAEHYYSAPLKDIHEIHSKPQAITTHWAEEAMRVAEEALLPLPLHTHDTSDAPHVLGYQLTPLDASSGALALPQRDTAVAALLYALTSPRRLLPVFSVHELLKDVTHTATDAVVVPLAGATISTTPDQSVA